MSDRPSMPDDDRPAGAPTPSDQSAGDAYPHADRDYQAGPSAPSIQQIDELRVACSLPGPLFRVLEAIRDERSTKFTVARAVEQDPDLAERVLKAANSPLYLTYEDKLGEAGAGITNLPTAVLRIGLSAIRNLAYTQGICHLAGDSGELGMRLLAHLLVVGEISWSLGNRVNRPFAEDAYLAGLLHDFGKVVLLKNLPEDYRTIAAWCRRQRRPALEVEDETFRETQPFLLNHVKTALELMRAHYMPQGVLFTVEHHHDPLILNLHGSNPRHLTATVITANQLAYALGMGDGFGAPAEGYLALEKLAELTGHKAQEIEALGRDAWERARGALGEMHSEETPFEMDGQRVDVGAGGDFDFPQPVSEDYRAYERLIAFARAVSRFSVQDMQAHTGLDTATLEDVITRLTDKGYLKRDRRHTYHHVYRATQTLQRTPPQDILSTLASEAWRRPDNRSAA